jgi:DNA repair protein RecO (recombination protein O)
VLSRTESIILRTQKYGEADLIVTCLTSDRGIIRAFAKSPRKTGSRFGSSLEPLTHSKISLWGKEQSMPKITQSDIINSFQPLRESYNDFVNMSKLAEMVVSLIPESIPSRQVFSFFLSVMGLALSSDESSKYVLFLIAQVRLLALTGYAPGLKGCGKCGKKSNSFYPDSGTILCGRCSSVRSFVPREEPMRIVDKTLSFYAHSMEWPLTKSHRLKPRREILSELALILEKHIAHLLNRKLLSSGFTPS